MGVQFDVYYDNHAAASAHGHQTWEAYIADSNGNQEVQVTTTKEVNRLDVTMTNHILDAVLRSRMTEEEQERYDAYNKYYGNRDYLFDLNSIPTGSSGFGYDIPADALSDPQFAKMIQEAEKYLGVPYVWGGYSPSGFDCSGFVSWVINNCGNGWNVGRCTADELRSHCSQVSLSEAKPGDLIFFTGTYSAGTPVTHVGIYIGNGQMIHAGDPVQYANINTSYWTEQFLRIWAYLNQLKIGGNKLNPKIDKLARDIEKTEKKIADLQKKLELFKEEKTRLENEDYGDIGRDFHLTPKELAEFFESAQGGHPHDPGGCPACGRTGGRP